MNHPLSDDAQGALEAWPKRSRGLFAELLEDAGSELQRELLERALVAGHTPGEVHAFADELRGLDDDGAFSACTLDRDAPNDFTVAQLLRAEGDPLYAFELNGGTISPAEEEAPPEPPPAPTPPVPPETAFDTAPPPPRARSAPPQGFDGRSREVRAPRFDWNDLGGGGPPPPSLSRAPGTAPLSSARLIEDLASEATRALGLSWREQELDVPNGPTLEQTLPLIANALARGLPVPCALGAKPGASRRLVLFLQMSTSGRTRAFQLFDPFSQELVWVNEGDLLKRTELPFADAANRRVTRVALPQGR
jgi:hypothetical protein